MSAAGKGTGSSPDHLEFKMPEALAKIFGRSPRIIIKRFPPGLMPLDIELLRNPEALRALAESAEFKENFDIVIIPKG